MASTAYPARAEDLSRAEIQALAEARPGGIVTLSNLWVRQHELPSIPLRISPERSPQLILSDRPEYFLAGNGIALQEEVKPGVVRLYIYHVPQPTNGPKTISAVMENLGKKPLEFRFLRRAFNPPSVNYYRIGKLGLLDFFDSQPEKMRRRLRPGERMVIDPTMDAATATTDELVHGFYEFSITQPARITTFERDPGQSSLTVIDSLPKLPLVLPGGSADGAGRGLFLTNNFQVTGEKGFVYDTAQGPMRLLVADGRHDLSMEGRDAIEGVVTKDRGNYGALYRIKIKRSSSDGRNLALLITQPDKGGKWCGGQAGAVRINRGKFPGGTVAIPAGQTYFGQPGELVLIQTFPPVSKFPLWHIFTPWLKRRTDTIELLYSPPGASCIPTPLLLVPY